SSRRRHTRWPRDWSSDVCSSDLGATGLERALENLQQRASQAIADGYNVIILSDRGIGRDRAAIPSLLATAAVHHHLVRRGERTRSEERRVGKECRTWVAP